MQTHLTSQRAESEGVVQAPFACLAGVGNALGWSRLWPFVQEDHPGAVDDVSLHAGDVQHLLYLGDTDYVVIGRAADLHCGNTL